MLDFIDGASGSATARGDIHFALFADYDINRRKTVIAFSGDEDLRWAGFIGAVMRDEWMVVNASHGPAGVVDVVLVFLRPGVVFIDENTDG